MDLVWFLIICVVQLAVWGLVVWYLTRRMAVPIIPPPPSYPVPPPPATPVHVPAKASEPMVRIRLVTEKGQVVRECTMPARLRRTSLSMTVHHQRQEFLASHQDGAVWVYRRVPA